MRYEKIVTLFDTADHAEAARKDLEQAGFAASDISLIGRHGMPSGATALREPGLWHKLFGRDIEAHEARVYGSTIEAGGSVLTLRAIDEDVPRAMGILNQHNLVDLRNRAMEKGFLSGRTATPASTATAASVPITPLTPDVGKGEVLHLAEEQLEVGKRLVTSGTTRIRRFVTESPVEAQVKLHEEHIEVVRRAAADPSYVKDIDWTDRTIEITETAEEAVVSKSVHVAEEVLVAKKGSDRVETVRDTVRRQHVEVEPAVTAREHAMRSPRREAIR
jgi:uncharacterized protein (TIGR02271 family)